MKLIISVLLFTNCYVAYGFFRIDCVNCDKAEVISKIFQDKYMIPSSLIELRPVSKCHQNEELLWPTYVLIKMEKW